MLRSWTQKLHRMSHIPRIRHADGSITSLCGHVITKAKLNSSLKCLKCHYIVSDASNSRYELTPGSVTHHLKGVIVVR